jgi:hypothetical protein
MTIILYKELHELIYFFCFQFEEKFIATPEELEKLKTGKTKYLNIPPEGIPYKVSTPENGSVLVGW